jgi:hypothetical protein
LALLIWLGLAGAASPQSLAVLPNALTQFVDANGAPLAGGRVFFYVPGTTTPSPTWLDPFQTTLNSNPVILDSAGRAAIFGSGLYRQVLQDQFGNVVWDQLTLSSAVPPGSGTGVFLYQNSPTIISPTLTGFPTAPTQAPGDTSNAIATDAFVAAAIAAIVPPTNAVPSKAIMGFNLGICPAGWVPADGSGGTLDLRGVVARGLDNGRGADTSGTGLGGFENDQFQSHQHSSEGGYFLTLTGGTFIGGASPITTFDTKSQTGGPSSGRSGSETRGKATVVLYCEKS